MIFPVSSYVGNFGMRGQIADREGRPENPLNLARLVRIARCDNQLHARQYLKSILSGIPAFLIRITHE